MKNLTVNDLNTHMFEAIEMLKNNSDPRASKQEKIDVETAKAIAQLGTVIVEGFKAQVNAVGILSRSQNPSLTGGVVSEMGILPEHKSETK